MDPVSLIVAAVVSGASAALNESASDAVKSAYGNLKQLLARKLRGDRAARTALDEVDADPEAWQAPLESRLRQAWTEADQTLIRAAQELLAQVDPEGTQRGKYTVTVVGSRGVQIGDNATMIFKDD